LWRLLLSLKQAGRALIVATDVLLLLHVPPDVASVSWWFAGAYGSGACIGDSGCTIIVATARQPLLESIRYSSYSRRHPGNNTCHYVNRSHGGIATAPCATRAALLNAVVCPTQTLAAPVIGDNAITLTVVCITSGNK